MKTKNNLSYGHASDDDNVRYKLNAKYFKKNNKTPPKLSKTVKKTDSADLEDKNIRYKFPEPSPRKHSEQKVKPKPIIKVNFWSSKHNATRVQKSEQAKSNLNRRHTIASSSEGTKAKPSAVKVRKRVSFLPTPLFLDSNVPMVTVPDDLTIQLNEEEANYLQDDLNPEFLSNGTKTNSKSNSGKRKSRSSTTQTSPKGAKRKHEIAHIQYNAHELEYFSKYIVQKLRKMETNQRIYSENLINIVLMHGQLGKLNGKCRITET